ncbi:uncharacterized protein LOC130614007 [Hydractinia symbiolongicarpus]|uniref:uncharacterized protein LOC130614007 n=1 Tax=Hydractinia symbiolongicarpus TaxID=13093 RepID=UPI0025508477|nr:uncharacterized protein LOC130614007 [Hydractinia symbiolongicarpus]
MTIRMHSMFDPHHHNFRSVTYRTPVILLTTRPVSFSKIVKKINGQENIQFSCQMLTVCLSQSWWWYTNCCVFFHWFATCLCISYICFLYFMLLTFHCWDSMYFSLCLAITTAADSALIITTITTILMIKTAFMTEMLVIFVALVLCCYVLRRL